MKPPRTGPDPRLVLLGAVPLLVALGLGVRTILRPGPAAGWRINRALDLAEAGRHDLALPIFLAALEGQPEEPQLWLRAGRELRVLGRSSEAVEHFRRAAELDPGDETLQYELARGLLESGDTESAARAAEATLAIEPDHAGAIYVQAAIAGRRGEAPAAGRLLARALELEPTLRPDRYRGDESFDPVRNDQEFLDAVLARNVPDVFGPAAERSR